MAYVRQQTDSICLRLPTPQPIRQTRLGQTRLVFTVHASRPFAAIDATFSSEPEASFVSCGGWIEGGDREVIQHVDAIWDVV